jgi:hypothetical protein
MLSLIFGAGEESRTLDLNLGKVALYQLSYSRKTSAHYRDIRMRVNNFTRRNYWTILRSLNKRAKFSVVLRATSSRLMPRNEAISSATCFT